MSSAVTKITHEDAQAFVKFLMEAGGVYKVDDDLFIRSCHDDEKIVIEEKDGDEKAIPIKIYHTMRSSGEYFVLNPFKETTVANKALQWFIRTIKIRLAMTTLSMIEDIITLSLNKDDTSGKLVELLNIIDVAEIKPEANMVEQLNSIDPEDIMTIFYQPRQKQGQIQSNLDDPETWLKYKKVKKKTWTVINDVFWAIFGCAPNEIHKLFTYTATTIPAPQSETVITLFFRFYKLVEPICKILGIAYPDIEQFSNHLVYIEKYQRLATYDDTLVNRPVKEIVPPWHTEIKAPTGEIVTPIQTKVSSGVPQVVMTNHGMQAINTNVPVTSTIVPQAVPTGHRFGNMGFVQQGAFQGAGAGITFGTQAPRFGGMMGGNQQGMLGGGIQFQKPTPRYPHGVL